LHNKHTIKTQFCMRDFSNLIFFFGRGEGKQSEKNIIFWHQLPDLCDIFSNIYLNSSRETFKIAWWSWWVMCVDLNIMKLNQIHLPYGSEKKFFFFYIYRDDTRKKQQQKYHTLSSQSVSVTVTLFFSSSMLILYSVLCWKKFPPSSCEKKKFTHSLTTQACKIELNSWTAKIISTSVAIVGVILLNSSYIK
jgi:hypothetical protein